MFKLVDPTVGDLFTTAMAGFTTNLWAVAPVALGIGVVAFSIPFVWRWGRSLVS